MLSYITGKRKQVLVSICNYIGHMVLGFVISWPIAVLPKLQHPKLSPLPDRLSEVEISLLATVLYLGCIPGPYITGWLSNVKGRKPCLILGGVVTSISFIIMATSTNLATMYCGRIASGVGSATIAVTNLLYLGEIASTSIRGILLTTLGICTTLGSVVLLTSGYFLTYSETTFVGLALSLVFTTSALFIPESPYFYLLKGDDVALRKVLEEFGRTDEIDALIEARKDISEMSFKRDWIELFTLRSNKRALFIVVVLNILQHCSGVMAVGFFSSIIFEMAGSSIDPIMSMLIIAGFQLLGCVISPLLVEKSGRKILLAVSSAICCLSMILLGLYFYWDHIESSVIDNLKWLPLVILILYFIGYEIGMTIIPNVLIGEMFTPNVRSKGSAVTFTTSWVVGFIITTAFGALVENVGGHILFWFFALICFCTVFFSMFCVVETKGKSLLEIQKMLN